jgi:hypothetical protein
MKRLGLSGALTRERAMVGSTRRGLRLAEPGRVPTGPPGVRGPDKYRMLELKRRRAQIRARRELGVD